MGPHTAQGGGKRLFTGLAAQRGAFQAGEGSQAQLPPHLCGPGRVQFFPGPGRVGLGRELTCKQSQALRVGVVWKRPVPVRKVACSCQHQVLSAGAGAVCRGVAARRKAVDAKRQRPPCCQHSHSQRQGIRGQAALSPICTTGQHRHREGLHGRAGVGALQHP